MSVEHSEGNRSTAALRRESGGSKALVVQEALLGFGRYTITVCLEDDTRLPGYLGSTLRGAFGAALKRSMCGNVSRDCSTCGLSTRCLYTKTFEPKVFPDDVNLRGMEPPAAYVVEPPAGRLSHLAQGAPLVFHLLLFGDANTCLPFFLNAFELMGRRGIGRRSQGSGGGRFVLQRVQQDGAGDMFDPQTGRIRCAPKTHYLRLASTPDDGPRMLEVKIETPLRLKFQNQLQDQLPFHVLVRSALRRVSSVFAVYGTGEPSLPYANLVVEAQSVSTRECALRWLDWERYSSRQQSRMKLGGIVGTVRYGPVSAAYVPVLEMASLLHLGKQSTFGLGKLALCWRSQEPE